MRCWHFFLLAALLLAPVTHAQVLAEGCTTGVVRTGSGPVCGHGVVASTGAPVNAFLGIPYAASTAGAARWTPPRAPQAWQQPRAALRFGPSCPQTLLPTASAAAAEDGDGKHHGTRAPVRQPAPESAPGEDEDCLSINVWAPPDAAPGSALPVMAFIHGGAFVSGGSADPLYDGSALAAKGVLVVSFNYRLGVLGFLAARGMTGNYGLRDQQAALRWVRDNIAGFGGDPARVTLFGHSAGAMSVGLHLQSAPASRPLFRAAIMQSNFLGLPYQRLAEAHAVGDMFRLALGCADLACLRRAGVQELLALQAAYPPQLAEVLPSAQFFVPFGPVLDGQVLDRQPTPARLRKPVLLGTVRDEMVAFYSGRQAPPVHVITQAAALYGRAFERVLARYPLQPGNDNWLPWARMQTDSMLACSTRHVALRSQAAVHLYRFDHSPTFPVWGGPPCAGGGYACHSAELAFVVHATGSPGVRVDAAEEQLSQEMMDAWTNFARSLDPNGATAVPAAWPRFNPDRRSYRIFDTGAPKVAQDPLGETCSLWDEVGYTLTDPWR
jgi:carboxylesterase type B